MLKTGLLLCASALVIGLVPRQEVLSSNSAQSSLNIPGRLIFSASPSGDDSGSSSIYYINADGTRLQRFINDADYPGASFPSVSPDGSRIAFSSVDAEGWNIYAADVLNGEIYDVDRLTDTDGLFPSWSPDGRHIAFISARYGWQSLFVMGADGSNQYRLSSMSVMWGNGAGYFFSWSPDSEAIAFTASQRNVVVVDVSSGQITQILDYSEWPAWSPDGARIALSKWNSGGIWSLVLAQAADLRQRQLLADFAGDVLYPLWSPAGDKLSFIAETGDGYAVYVIDADGTNPQRLNTIVSALPVWSPDGQYLASVSTCDGHEAIFVIAVDGENQTGRCLPTANLSAFHIGGWLAE